MHPKCNSTAVVFSSNTSSLVIKILCFIYIWFVKCTYFAFLNIKVFTLLKENWKCENTWDRLWKDAPIDAVDDVMLFQ